MPMSKLAGGAICLSLLAVWGICQMPSGAGDVAARQTLSIKEAPDRVVLGWSGPVQAPMSERLAAALARYRADPRRLVLVLNSPGGSVEHGRQVVAAIGGGGRAIDTLVEKAGVCASMCVPIFLAGTQRMADPEALFMFHQVSLGGRATETVTRPELSASEKAVLVHAVKTVETQATDAFFRHDIGLRGVSTAWLAMMRAKITGRDVWMSGQQLVDEGSGIVDRLVPTAGG